MTQKARDCPKCGGNNLDIGDCGYSSFNVAWVRCKDCTLKVKVLGDSAITEWNNWAIDPLKMLAEQVQKQHHNDDDVLDVSEFVVELIRSTVIDLNADLNILCAALGAHPEKPGFTDPQGTSQELALKCYKAVQRVLCGIRE